MKSKLISLSPIIYIASLMIIEGFISSKTKNWKPRYIYEVLRSREALSSTYDFLTQSLLIELKNHRGKESLMKKS